MTKEENPQTQERDFPLSWKAQTPRFPHSHRTATAAVSRFNTQSKPQPRFALLATFPTYPQIPRRRHKKKWMELCEQAADEQDSKKLAALILRINFMLEAKELRLKDATVSLPPPAKTE